MQLLGAVALASNGACSREDLLAAILEWLPFKKMVDEKSKGRA